MAAGRGSVVPFIGVFLVSILLLPGIHCSEDVDGLSEVASSATIVAVSVLVAVCLIAALLYCADNEVKPRRGVPPWVKTIQLDPVLAQGCMEGCSDGITILDVQTVMRHRTGHFEVDGARWSCPLSKGKHVFEIHWPQPVRGTLASVGVGTINAPLFVKPRETLVGYNRESWGLDLGRRKVIHNKQILETMPKVGIMPDMFFMYVDCDSRTVGFGTPLEYLGAPLSFPASALPVYVTVGLLKAQSQVKIYYRGSEMKQVQQMANTVVRGPQDSVTIVTTTPGGPPPPYQQQQQPLPQQQQQPLPQQQQQPLPQKQQQEQENPAEEKQ